MNDNFKTIVDALIKEGFQSLTDAKEAQGRPLDYKISQYSLNTALSFKFNNLPHFIEFLKLHELSHLSEKSTVLQTTLMELSIDPNSFFYVNFFEKGNDQQL